MEQEVDEAVGIGGLLEEDHEHQPDGKGIRDIGQEIDRLEELFERLDRVEAEGDEEREARGDRDGDEDEDHRVFHRLQEIRIAQDVGEVIEPDAEIRLGGGIVSLFKRIHHYIDERIDHEEPQKCDSRREVKPCLETVFLHVMPPMQSADGCGRR